jgi:hypothetical protein
MQTLTEIVAAVVVHSSAVAYSHFGVTLDAKPTEQPVPAERTVARSAVPKVATKMTSKMTAKPVAAGVSLREECPEPRLLIGSA